MLQAAVEVSRYSCPMSSFGHLYFRGQTTPRVELIPSTPCVACVAVAASHLGAAPGGIPGVTATTQTAMTTATLDGVITATATLESAVLIIKDARIRGYALRIP